MRLNVKKTKELWISFFNKPVQFDNLTSAATEINIVDNFKLLGVTISSDLTWNTHIDIIRAKASRRLYALRILKRSGAPPKNFYACLLRIYQISSRICMSSMAFRHSTTHGHCEFHYHICHTAMDLKP